MRPEMEVRTGDTRGSGGAVFVDGGDQFSAVRTAKGNPSVMSEDDVPGGHGSCGGAWIFWKEHGIIVAKEVRRWLWKKRSTGQFEVPQERIEGGISMNS